MSSALKNITSLSLIKLQRARQNLAVAQSQGRWHQMAQLDADLMSALEQAKADPYRDAARLLGETRQIINLYQDLLAWCEAGKINQ